MPAALLVTRCGCSRVEDVPEGTEAVEVPFAEEGGRRFVLAGRVEHPFLKRPMAVYREAQDLLKVEEKPADPGIK